MASTQIIVNIYSFIILLILSLVFFSKQRMRHVEDNTYAKILLTTIGTLLVGIILGALVSQNINDILTIMLNKVYLIGLTVIITLFSFYTYNVFKKGQNLETVRSFYIVLYVLNFVIILLAPLNIEINENGAIPTGLALYYTFSYLTIMYIVMLIFLVIDRKNLKNPKYIPIILIIISFIVFAFILAIMPTLNYFLNPLVVSIILIMYFTIENPDIKMMEELYKNKKIIEGNIESTSNFLFKVSQDMKTPVDQIINISSKKSDDDLKKINNLSKNLKHIISDTLDVSTMSSKNLKVYNTKYNPRNIFDEVKVMAKNKLNDKVNFEYNVSTSLPNYVYGDSIKLKQILVLTLEECIKHTKECFISFDVNTIIKYGVCRFSINITDSGKGISIHKINEILSLDVLSDDDFDNEVINLVNVRMMVNKLGGSFMLKSEDKKGTTVNIVLDQKIYEPDSKNKDAIKKLAIYESTLNKGNNIMVVDDDVKELSYIKKYLENKGMIVSSSLYGNDVIEKLEENYNFDLIILDDETNTYSALNILEELKKIDNFNIPVVVMINDNKETIRKHYLKDGFTDVIRKSNVKEELDRVLNR